MIVVMRLGASPGDIEAVKAAIVAEGLEAYTVVGEERSVIGVVGNDVDRVRHVASFPGVETVMRVLSR